MSNVVAVERMSNEDLSRHLNLRHLGPALYGPVHGPLASAGLMSALRAWHTRLHQTTAASHQHSRP